MIEGTTARGRVKSGTADWGAATYLYQLRTSRGLSADQLGHLARVSGQTIRNIESNGSIPHIATQLRIARFFDKLPNDIWTIRRCRRGNGPKPR